MKALTSSSNRIGTTTRASAPGFVGSDETFVGAQTYLVPALGASASWTAPVLWRFFRDRESARGLAQSKTWRHFEPFLAGRLCQPELRTDSNPGREALPRVRADRQVSPTKFAARAAVWLALWLTLAAAAWGAEPLPAKLPPHPRLLFAPEDVPKIKERIATQPWAKTRFDELQRQAENWLKTEVKLPPRGGQWFHYYSCPKHGARLRNEGPTRHVCPIDGEVLTGYPYDDVVLSSEHNRLASAIRTLGIVHQLTGDARYAAKAKEILLAYAGKYQSYPLHNIRGEAQIGGGKVGPQTLDESTWLITVVEGVDCFWDTLSDAERKQVETGLLYPATDVIRQHKMSIHNIQCWKNSAVGLAGLLVGDMKLVDEALNAEVGYFKQMAKGTTADGAWYEGAWGYHFYTMSAVSHLTEGAFHSGINLYGDAFKRMFDAPLALAMPDLRLPAFNDSHTVSIAGSAGLYEIAYARYKDERYRVVIGTGKRDSDLALLHGVTLTGTAPAFSPASKNYPASGYAILASGQGSEATWFCLDYGPHGGGHGHPDKLGFVWYGQNQILAPDPGTANYGVPIQGGWYRTTIAHNTLTVDEGSQKQAEGKCVAFLSSDGFSAVMAEAGKIYDGVLFRRTVALLGDDLLVFIDQISADRAHTFDLAYHNVGRLSALPDVTSFVPSQKAGYSYLREMKSVSTGQGLTLTFSGEGGQPVHWAMAAGEPTTFIAGTGVGAHTEDRVPIVIARRRTNQTTYFWCVSLGQSARPIELVSEAVKLPEGITPATTDVAAVRVKVLDITHIIVANASGGRVLVAGQEMAGKIAHLSASGGEKHQTRHEVE